MNGPSSEPRPKTPEQGPGNKFKMLFVEDDPIVTKLARFPLGIVEGLDLTACEYAEEALELLQRAKAEGSPYDLVISDRGLAGEMTGVDLYQTIASGQDAYGSPVFAFLTGSPDRVREELPGFEKDGGMIMAKPFSPIKLTDYVNEIKSSKLSKPQA